MALKSGSIIKVNEFLLAGDYIESPNRLFFAIMQGDGNFVVYRGAVGHQLDALWASNKCGTPGNFFAIMQSDGNFVVYQGTPGAPQEVWWAANKWGPLNSFFAVMQDDGNFVVYKGTSPSDQQEAWWATDSFDPVVDCEVSSIDYDVNAAKTLHTIPAELYRQTVKNDTMQTQTSTISGSTSVSVISGWSDSLAIKVGAKTTFDAGIPLVGQGKVELSLEVTGTFVWNGSTTNTKTWGFNTPVSVPPNTVILGLVAATVSTIAVPYTLTGTLIFKSGTRMPGQIGGIYTGTNSHDLTITYVQQDPVALHMVSTTQALKATSS